MGHWTLSRVIDSLEVGLNIDEQSSRHRYAVLRSDDSSARGGVARTIHRLRNLGSLDIYSASICGWWHGLRKAEQDGNPLGVFGARVGVMVNVGLTGVSECVLASVCYGTPVLYSVERSKNNAIRD